MDYQYLIKMFKLKNFQLKHTFYLDSNQEDVSAITINDKIIAYSNDHGHIFIKNIFTE